MNKIILILLFLTSCQSNKFLHYYNEETRLSYIPRNKSITLIQTNILDKKLEEYKKMGYKLLGYSVFNGYYQPKFLALKVAKKVGATVVLFEDFITNEEEVIYYVPYTKTNTVYHQGNFNTTTYTNGSIGNFNTTNYYNSTTYGTTFYNGTSTYQTTEFIENSYRTFLYKQTALFLTKMD